MNSVAWSQIYDEALRFYSARLPNDHPERMARRTADKAMGKIPFADNERPLPLPNFARAIALGDCLELVYITTGPRLMVISFDPRRAPKAVATDSRTIMVFPGAKYLGPPKAVGNAPGQAERLYQTWAWRRARTEQAFDIDEQMIETVGLAEAITYRSDKRIPPKMNDRDQDYVHQFEEGVRMDVSDGMPPEAIVISGGRMSITPWGITH